MIGLEKFVEVIECLRKQKEYDEFYSLRFENFLGSERVLGYNNKSLIDGVMIMLREWFPVDENGFCEIEFYCYVLDFGNNGSEVESVEELYRRLLSNVGKG